MLIHYEDFYENYISTAVNACPLVGNFSLTSGENCGVLLFLVLFVFHVIYQRFSGVLMPSSFQSNYYIILVCCQSLCGASSTEGGREREREKSFPFRGSSFSCPPLCISLICLSMFHHFNNTKQNLSNILLASLIWFHSVTKSSLSCIQSLPPSFVHFFSPYNWKSSIILIAYQIVLLEFSLTPSTSHTSHFSYFFVLPEMGLDHHAIYGQRLGLISISLFFLIISSWIHQGLVTEGK